MTSLRSPLAFCTLALGFVASAAAQGSPAIPPTVITTTGTGVVNLSPDRAIVEVSIETRGNSASGAAADNAQRQTTLLAQLRRLGFSEAKARVVDYSVSAEYDYREGRKLIGYEATTSVAIALDTIARLGATLDAALAAGATNIGRIRYTSDSAASGRARALAQALAAARADAEALASAAGGRLGSLQLVTTWPPPSGSFDRSDVLALQPGLVASTGTLAVTPQDVSITVSVYTTWTLLR